MVRRRVLRSVSRSADRVGQAGGGAALPVWAREILIFMVAYLVYQTARTVGTGSLPDATEAAHRVLAFERAVIGNVEAAVQAAILDTPWMSFLNWVYVLAQTVVLVGGIAFVFRRSRPVYRVLRTTLIGAWMVALPIYALYPTAPPRLAGIGMLDTVSRDTPFALDSPTTTVFYNPYAAVPSLHAGFAVALGIAVACCVRSRPIRIGAVMWGPVVSLSVLATGNHFVVDIIVGIAVTLVAFCVAVVIRSLPSRREKRRLRSGPPTSPLGQAATLGASSCGTACTVGYRASSWKGTE